MAGLALRPPVVARTRLPWMTAERPDLTAPVGIRTPDIASAARAGRTTTTVLPRETIDHRPGAPWKTTLRRRPGDLDMTTRIAGTTLLRIRMDQLVPTSAPLETFLPPGMAAIPVSPTLPGIMIAVATDVAILGRVNDQHTPTAIGNVRSWDKNMELRRICEATEYPLTKKQQQKTNSKMNDTAVLPNLTCLKIQMASGLILGIQSQSRWW